MFRTAIILAGLSQIAIAATSLLIPRLLGWQEETARLKPLTRQVFWTYATYTFATNLAFGLLSTFAPDLLLDGSRLAAIVSAFICLYWAARVTLQFTYYDRTVAAARGMFRYAEVVYVSGFAYLVVVYGLAAAHNLRGA
ncbi:MAG TPA: hypothetical protein VHK90_14605 [Thermoanaerobaculia bacterium]|nr:hypothetical protein [Thermoanaerobaculia bacterium]